MHHANAIERLSRATRFAVQLFHPAMQLRMLSPVMQLTGVMAEASIAVPANRHGSASHERKPQQMTATFRT
jgi:hypothetical protein